MTSTHAFLEVLNRLGREQIPVRKVYRRLRDRQLFLAAYGRLYARQGTMPVSIIEDTVDGMSLQRIDALMDKLVHGQYRWTPAKKTTVQHKGQVRAVVLPTWEDRLLQEVIRMVLEAYYEPQFSASCHGFRPGRGCHTALRQIRDTWNGTVWFIRGDVKGCFESLPHVLILEVLGRSFQDNRFLKLIREYLQTGVTSAWNYHKTYSGTPQGGILSPILTNIVLSELDHWVEETLVPTYTAGRRRRRNPAYTRAVWQATKAKRVGDVDAIKAARKAQLATRIGNPMDPDYRRLKYCRYADDFLLGFIGPRSEAVAIQNRLREFLESLGLRLQEEKAAIVHARSGRVRFLGYEIKVAYDDSKQKAIRRYGQVVKTRTMSGKVQLLVPRDVVNRYVAKYSQKGKPTARADRLFLSDFDIIAQYGAELRGLVQYYRLALNIHSLSHVEWTMMDSAARTLAGKHKCSRKSIYRKYCRRAPTGKKGLIVTLPNPNNPAKPYQAVLGATPLRTDKEAILNDRVFVPAVTTTQLVERLLAQECELCGSDKQIQVHHIRALKDLRRRWQGRNEKPLWVQRMIQYRRKTLVVCRACHLAIHAGRYDKKAIETS